MKIEKRDLVERPFRVGPWLVEPSLNRISRGDATIQLELRIMDVLVYLASRAGEVVPRQEIVNAVWATEVISDNTLTHTIAEVRNALGDDVKTPRYIETHHRRGYRLVAPVVAAERSLSDVAEFPVREGAAIPADEPNPYPGLAAFTEKDAEFFFGRESEVAQMWRKLTSRRLLAVIGPSGVGKTSFLRAGIIPAKPEGWGVVVCEPGSAPFASLAKALVPTFADDNVAISKLVYLKEQGEAVAMVSRWRERHDHGLMIVDQCEELFTLNPLPIQARFAELLRRLVDEADVHVLVSLRDDFLYRCHDYGRLAPLFDSLTAVKAPVGGALRRAVVEPARRLGYAFEGEELIDEVVFAVRGERGALPLVAFAVAKLWDMRDRERRLLTLQAYEEIGGVSGALARHAETTLKTMGEDRVPIVRELFRNLATAQGTRLARTTEELLSIFDEREPLGSPVGEGEPKPAFEAATEVLECLCEARLLTCFEAEMSDAKKKSMVEVVHESLFSSWPRLVAWRTQDADGARLRDELRQAAKLWADHERSVDLLWTGMAYKEYLLWKNRYPGRLSEVEEDFGRAMTAHARRRKIRRRSLAVAVLVCALALAVGFGALWRRSVHHAHRAEAAELIALGQLEMEDYPTSAVAHAIASLDLADSPAARRLAIEALWRGPTALVASNESRREHAFSPDGRWLVMTRSSVTENSSYLSLVRADGAAQDLEYVHVGSSRVSVFMGSKSEAFVSAVTTDDGGCEIVLWSVAERRPLAQTMLTGSQVLRDIVVNADRRRAVLLISEDGRFSADALGFDGTFERLGTLDFELRQDETGRWTTGVSLDPREGEWLGVFHENRAYFVDIGSNGLGPPQLLGRHENWVTWSACDPFGRYFATAERDGEIHLWSLDGASPPRVLNGPPGHIGAGFSIDGSLFGVAVRQEETIYAWVWRLSTSPPTLLRRANLGFSTGLKWDPFRRQVAQMNPDGSVRVWTLAAPADAEPMTLHRGDVPQVNAISFASEGDWLATADSSGLALWPLTGRYPVVIGRHGRKVFSLAFAPGGEWLATSSSDGSVRLWPLDGDPPPPGRVLRGTGAHQTGLAASTDGRTVLVGGNDGSWLLPVEGGPPRRLVGLTGQTGQGAFSPDGRFAAQIGGRRLSSERVIRVWDTSSWSEAVELKFDEGERPCVRSLQFTDGGGLLTATNSGLFLWDLETGDRSLLYEGALGGAFAASADGRRAVLIEVENEQTDAGHTVLLDVDSHTAKPLDAFGENVVAVAMDPEGAFVATGSVDGELRAGLLNDEEPHLLLGHETSICRIAIDPRGRWIASCSGDSTIRLWPMPDFSKPPLHTLPREELIAKLKTLTNLRVVRDEESATGWKLEVGPFPGWETVPSW